jgi:hypothetical protein
MDAYNKSMADSELKIAALQKRVAELEGYIAQAKSDHEAHIRTYVVSCRVPSSDNNIVIGVSVLTD